MKTGKKRIGWFIFTFLLWNCLIIWTGYYWLLLVHLLFIDLFITRIIDWSFKRYPLPPLFRKFIEWTGIALIAIIIPVSIKTLFIEAYKIPTPSMEETLLSGDFIFVSKLAYGPKLPNTPLSVPFLPNYFHSGIKTYSDKLQLPYKRLKGFSRVHRNDIIVFSFPEGDTMITQYPGQNYYSLVRQYGKTYIHNNFSLISHPVDKRENYIKRCVALPGDTLTIENGRVWVNNEVLPEINTLKYKFYVSTNGLKLPATFLDSLGVEQNEVTYNPANSLQVIYLTMSQSEQVEKHPSVRGIKRFV